VAGNVPAATRALAVLRTLASAASPLTAASLARDLCLPRSSVYHLLAAMEDAGFVTHFPEEGRWGLGVGAFEVGAAYLRHDPLERLARPLVQRLSAEVSQITPAVAHLGVLHGRETLYLLKETPSTPVTIVAEVGVRLPASLTASGRALLADLPPAQVRALFPDVASFVDRTGAGPMTLRSLNLLLGAERLRGWAEEDGFITAGLASVAIASHDHDGRPAASVGLTFRSDQADGDARAALAAAARRCAREITRRLSGSSLNIRS
jgi:DNA-binding IclR family transcriptional regulator